MNWYKKFIIVCGISLTAFFPISKKVQQDIDASVPQYLQGNLIKIIEEQNRALNIKHFGVPKIFCLDFPLIQGLTEGFYIPEEDRIYFPLGLAITPEKNLSNILVKILNFGKTHDIKETLAHELGHFYMDKLSESLENGNWPPFPKGKNSYLGTRIISEGIAEYFRKKMNQEEDNFRDSDWPIELDDFWKLKVIYDGGFHLVKPVIDKHGKRGIEYLIKNVPKMQELSNLQEYQKKVIDALSKNN